MPIADAQGVDHVDLVEDPNRKQTTQSVTPPNALEHEEATERLFCTTERVMWGGSKVLYGSSSKRYFYGGICTLSGSNSSERQSVAPKRDCNECCREPLLTASRQDQGYHRLRMDNVAGHQPVHHLEDHRKREHTLCKRTDLLVFQNSNPLFWHCALRPQR